MVKIRKRLPMFWLVSGLMISPGIVSAQTVAQLVEGAKKEGQLVVTGARGQWAGSRARRRWKRLSTKPTA